MRTCLFGGSFDPVHEGHVAIAERARQRCKLDRVVFLPAARSPFKTDKPTLFSGEQRLAMLRAATRHLPWAIVSELDLTMPPPSWSWRIVDAWEKDHPNDELFWLLGTDQWQELHRWGRYDYLCDRLCFLVYHRRTPPQPRAGVRSVFLEGEHPANSSSIREALRSGTPLPAAWLHPEVKALCYRFAQDFHGEN